ncbi:MAG TPA: isochorismatase family cysteine hydrolase [Bryobacteraceae bacterium]|jgi:nicotinamidase-related amidase|nr:isochorismatase family cysteine hydrolase [Bryobacteraceae bacterium]
MPLTKLDSTAALVVIDLQKGIVSIPTVHPVGEIIAHTAQLARAFRKRGLPVVLVNVTGIAPGRTDAGARNMSSLPADWAELVPELEQKPEDHIVSKRRVGAFIGTSLDDYLRQREVTQVFLTGVATSLGVESTLRSAYDYGYNVVAVVDAMTDRDADSHRHSVEKIFSRMGETATTDGVLKMLQEG